MNFIRFPMAGTNIFPAANSSAGYQLLSEWNLRSRESVNTPSAVKYYIGPSYTHSADDFAIRIQADAAGNPINTSAIEIMPGRALVNGHFIESLVSVVVDISEANEHARIEGLEPLKGELTVGLKCMYSTQSTIAGSILVENSENFFEGIQVVVLPSDQFILPEQSPQDENAVTAHLKLGTFYYINNAINPTTVQQNVPGKYAVMDADRVGNIDNLISDIYVRKTGLDPTQLYVFSGKGTDPNTGMDTWCYATDSLMVWDSNPKTQSDDPGTKQAEFGVDIYGTTQLVLPHKQVDFNTDTAGNMKYYSDRILNLPLANFNSETAGTINGAYTRNIKAIKEQINNIYRIPAGKQRGFVDILTDRAELPTLNSNWSVGDYVIVRQDQTVTGELGVDTTSVQSPSTMYVVLPGYIQSVVYRESRTDTVIPSYLTGIQIDRMDLNAADNDTPPNTADSETYNQMWGLPSTVYRGQTGVDYYVCVYTALPADENTDPVITRYYYSVASNTGPNEYSSPVFLTGGIPLATTEMIGGFYNVPETAQDVGYVYLDSDGHLRVLDYALLRSGTLAYQLGQDYSFGSGLSNEDIQLQLDEYVNDRVAFPNENQKANAANPNIINITLDLTALDSDTEDANEINIRNIDSRFGASVCLTITGTATSSTIINISDCQKIRIMNPIGGSPTINLYRSCLYYDANIIDSLNIIQDFKLWYERYSDDEANLLVDNMTVMEVDAPVIPEELDYWSETVPNDNHFLYALQSITFAGDGTIIRCGLYLKNMSTDNVQLGTSVIVGKFSLPQGAGLTYPISSLTKQLKVDGSFVTAYPSTDPTGYIVIHTTFTALTEAYSIYDTSLTARGNIAFYNNAVAVTNFGGVDAGTNIDAWSKDTFHTFEGGVIG